VVARGHAGAASASASRQIHAARREWRGTLAIPLRFGAAGPGRPGINVDLRWCVGYITNLKSMQQGSD
jgi:hypothetical protein